MCSRLREKPLHLIECWCEVVAPQGKDQPPWIIKKFPSIYNDEEVLKSVPQFTFPCAFENSVVQHFSFVLTSADSIWTYGFCRHAPGTATAQVILSHLPWHETFYKLLNHCSHLIHSENSTELWSCLQNIYNTPIPSPGSDLTIPYNESKFFVAHCPNHKSLPTIPENRNLSEYYNAIDIQNMIIIFASMLYERRIIITSKKLSRLSACVQAANSLIYPMNWQHIFIPVLPEKLLDYLLAPMPFLIGVPAALYDKINQDDIGEVVILDADTNIMKTIFDDLQSLPEEVTSTLKRSLKTTQAIGETVSRAFLRAIVQLIGNYCEALEFHDHDQKITFNREKFISMRPQNFQVFVEKMLELQIFQQFIEERLENLNRGIQTSDEFELEVRVYSERGSSKVKQFVTNVRKEGGAIMKTVKSKTNPAVKSAVKSVAKGGKQVKETYRGMKVKLRDPKPKQFNEDSKVYMNGTVKTQQPRSAPSSPVIPKRQPKLSVDSSSNSSYTAKISYKRSFPQLRREATDIGFHVEHRKKSAEPVESSETPSPQDLDLMGEMEEVLRRRLCTENLLSLDTPQSEISLSDSEKSCDKKTVNISTKDSMSASSLASFPTLDLSLDIPIPLSSFHTSAHPDECFQDNRSKYRSPKLFIPPFETPCRLSVAKSCTSSDACRKKTSTANVVKQNSNKRLHSVEICSKPSQPMNRKQSRAFYTLQKSASLAATKPVNTHGGKFPEYDVSKSFSDSLAKFSSKPENCSYFYSSIITNCRGQGDQTSFDLPSGQGDQTSFDLPSPHSLFSKDDMMCTSLPVNLAFIDTVAENTIMTQTSYSNKYLSSNSRLGSSNSCPSTGEVSECHPNKDLIYLGDPHEENFDPLLAKDIPPPVPARHKFTSNVITSLAPKTTTSREIKVCNDSLFSAINTTGLPNATPPKSKYIHERSNFKPYSVLQNRPHSYIGVENPLYKDYIPSGQFSPQTPMNTAAIFASSLLHQSDHAQAPIKPSNAFITPFFPETPESSPLSRSSENEIQKDEFHQNLLGNFSCEFQKLSINKQNGINKSKVNSVANVWTSFD